MKQRWIILDRDGVINQDSDDYVKSLSEFILIPGSVEAIVRLSQAGYQVLVATNQSGISRGFYDLDVLAQMHAKLHATVKALGGQIRDIVFCPHGPDEGCDCRKPKPGMYLTLAQRHDFELAGVPVIGDSLRDLQAAQQVGATPILVRTGKGERTLAKGDGLEGIPVYDDLRSAVDALLDEE